MGAFSVPDLAGPVDLEKQLDGIPAEAQTKGWLFRAVVDQVRSRGLEFQTPEYADFKDYSTREHVRLLGRAADLLAPGAPLTGLEQLGAATFPVFAGSLLGKIILEGAGRSEQPVLAALRMAPRVYAWMTAGRAQLALEEKGKTCVVLVMRQVCSFPGSYQLGLLTAAGTHLGVSVRICVASRGPHSADLLIEW